MMLTLSFFILACILVAGFLSRYNPMKVERTAWVFLVCALTGTAAVASVLYQGPFFVSDTNGVTQVTIGSGSASAVIPGGYVSFSRGGLVFLDTNSNTTTWGTFTGIATPSTSISQTFATAEPDTNYQILLTTVGITGSAGNIGPFYVGDKYTNSFEIRNPWKHGTAVSGTWLKFRTSTP
jgi:hypothetical protein